MDRSDTFDGITYENDGFLGEFAVFHPIFTAAWVDGEEAGTIYRKLTFSQSSVDEEYEEFLEDSVECTDTIKTQITYLYAGSFVTIVTNTYVLSDPITKAEFLSLTEAEMEADDWTASTSTGDYICSSFLTETWATYPYNEDPCTFYTVGVTTFGAVAALRKKRIRFRIPIAHTGSKFYITYDIAEFPTDGDPSFVSQDNTLEWTGPGTGDQSDPSWLTDWVVVPPPEVAGERRVVNIRYTCYSGTKYGAKPQVMGEVLEIPPP